MVFVLSHAAAPRQRGDSSHLALVANNACRGVRSKRTVVLSLSERSLISRERDDYVKQALRRKPARIRVSRPRSDLAGPPRRGLSTTTRIHAPPRRHSTGDSQGGARRRYTASGNSALIQRRVCQRCTPAAAKGDPKSTVHTSPHITRHRPEKSAELRKIAADLSSSLAYVLPRAGQLAAPSSASRLRHPSRALHRYPCHCSAAFGDSLAAAGQPASSLPVTRHHDQEQPWARS